MLHSRCIYGVPCGGVGSGTIGRSFTGDFTRFQISPGMYNYATVPADAFIVSVRDRSSDELVFQSVLGSRRHHRKRSDLKVPRGWEYKFRDEDISYRGLFPFAWFEYDIPHREKVINN